VLPKDNQKPEKEGIGEIKRTTGKAIKTYWNKKF
jgi:hypothetical protein